MNDNLTRRVFVKQPALAAGAIASAPFNMRWKYVRFIPPIVILFTCSADALMGQISPERVLNRFDGSAKDIAVVGRFCFVASYDQGLQAYDVSNPAFPVRVGQTQNSGLAWGVAISGNYAFLANGPDGLRVYDVTNPSTLTNVGHAFDGGNANAVAVSAGYAYLANDTDGLRIYDVADVSKPRSVGQASNHDDFNGGYARKVVLSGHYAYVANNGDGLRIYDVADPANPAGVGHSTNSGPNGPYATDVAVSGHYAFLANYPEGLRVYDVSDPANPVGVAQVINPGSVVERVDVWGDLAFLSCGVDGIRIYRVTDPSNPVLVSQFGAHGFISEAETMVVLGDYLYVGVTSGMQVYSLLPRLNVARLGDGFYRLSWNASATGFVMQVIFDLGPRNWITITNPPSVVSGQNLMTFYSTAGSQFFRLNYQK